MSYKVAFLSLENFMEKKYLFAFETLLSKIHITRPKFFSNLQRSTFLLLLTKRTISYIDEFVAKPGDWLYI